jgi:hypothetical protein
MYGDEVAIYFYWMKNFLQSIRLPAVLGLLTRLINMFFYQDTGNSPFSAIFSIFMAYWAAFFSVNWRREERSLKIKWDNLYYSERKFEQIRH